VVLSSRDDEVREKRKKLIQPFISRFVFWSLFSFFWERFWPDTPMDRKVLAMLASGLVAASIEV